MRKVEPRDQESWTVDNGTICDTRRGDRRRETALRQRCIKLAMSVAWMMLTSAAVVIKPGEEVARAEFTSRCGTARLDSPMKGWLHIECTRQMGRNEEVKQVDVNLNRYIGVSNNGELVLVSNGNFSQYVEYCTVFKTGPGGNERWLGCKCESAHFPYCKVFNLLKLEDMLDYDENSGTIIVHGPSILGIPGWPVDHQELRRK